MVLLTCIQLLLFLLRIGVIQTFCVCFGSVCVADVAMQQGPAGPMPSL